MLADLRRGVDSPLAQRPHHLGRIAALDREGDDGAALPAAIEHADAVDRGERLAQSLRERRARSRIASSPIAVA